MVVTGLNEKQMEALKQFLERLKADPAFTSPGGAPETDEPREAPADGIEFGDGRRWDNPLGAPFRK
jgi:hypothetical protein